MEERNFFKNSQIIILGICIAVADGTYVGVADGTKLGVTVGIAEGSELGASVGWFDDCYGSAGYYVG